MIHFNKPFLTGKEVHYMYQAVSTGKLSGNGFFTKKCQQFFEKRYSLKKCLLTTSGTDALEMCAMLCQLQPGDEVIVPSFTFVSTALAFVREGAKIVFADSMDCNPNIDAEKLESLITHKTKAIIPIHYAGVSSEMDKIMEIAEKYNLIVIEDAAQAIDSYYIPNCKSVKSQRIRELAERYKGKIPLGAIGHLSAFSFHETKNITSGGEGGLLVINEDRFINRAEIIWEKGTNRAEFYRGMVNKYGWCDVGSSFLPAEINAAFLWAQLENLDEIQNKRIKLWEYYFVSLKKLADMGYFRLPQIPKYATNNAHMFYIVCRTLSERSDLIQFLKEANVLAPFHYLSLHKSDYYTNNNVTIPELPYCDMYSDCLVRMPMFYELTFEQVDYIVEVIHNFFEK